MLLRRFTDFILQSRFRAMAIAFLLSLIPLIGGASVGILIATLVTLRKGVVEGALVLGASLAPFLIEFINPPATSQPQILYIALITLVSINVLTWLLALVLRRYANWSLVIEVALMAGIVLICGVHFVYPEIQTFWGKGLTASFERIATVFNQFAPEGASSENAPAEMAASIKPYLTGFIIASVMFNALLQLVIARWWQAVMFNPGELRKELHQIRLSYVTVAVFIFVSILAYLGSAICLDIVPVLIGGFCASGLSVIHRLVVSNTMGWALLTIVYLGMLFIFPLGILWVAIVGVLDSLLDLRVRLRK